MAAGGGAAAEATGSRPPTADVRQPSSPPPSKATRDEANYGPGASWIGGRWEEPGEEGRAGALRPTLRGLGCVLGGRMLKRKRSSGPHASARACCTPTRGGAGGRPLQSTRVGDAKPGPALRTSSHPQTHAQRGEEGGKTPARSAPPPLSSCLPTRVQPGGSEPVRMRCV